MELRLQASPVHMNGRVYDPDLGRFISADPTVQYPMNSQNYNRYYYVNNNPLSFTDPSGFGFSFGHYYESSYDNFTDSGSYNLDFNSSMGFFAGESYSSLDYSATFGFEGDNISVTTYDGDFSSTYYFDTASYQGGSISQPVTVAPDSFSHISKDIVEDLTGDNSGSNVTVADKTGLTLTVLNFLLPYAKGSFGITKKSRQFRFYSNGWRGNQNITTYLTRAEAIAKPLGPLGLFVSTTVDATKVYDGQLSPEIATINGIGGTIGLIYPLVGIATAVNSLFGEDIGAAALEAAINAGPQPTLPPPDQYSDLQRVIRDEVFQ